MARTKRIFISDLHLGTQLAVSQVPPLHNYSWLDRNAKYLGRFLGQLLKRDDVAELVILGDLLDDWVIPAAFDPGHRQGSESSFAAILGAEHNRLIVTYLQSLAGSNSEIKVSYVPGNHDMALEKEFLQQHFPGIRCLGQYNPGLGVYQAGTIRAEHGHRFCLFNAPDGLSDADSYLPLGYFISRCAAQEWLNDGNGPEYMAVLAQFIKELLSADAQLPIAVLNAMAKEAGMHGNSRFRMPEGMASPSVAEIRHRFRDLMQRWNASPEHPEVDATHALLADAGALENIIWQVYGKSAKKTRIVVCGHTHSYALYAGNRYGYANLALEPDTQPPLDGYDFVYANAGAWVDQARLRTYVETHEDTDAGKHHVQVKKFTSDGKSVEMLGTYTRLE